MAKIKFEPGFELEHGEEGQYVLRFKLPCITMSPDATGGHFRQAGKEVLLAVRGLIDKVIGEEEKGEE